MSDHAKHSPSGAHRWMRCYGSLALEAGLPNEDTQYSAEGTAAHTIASRALSYKRDAAFFHGETVQVGMRVFTVDEEMALNIQVYLDDVRARAKGAELLVEQRLNMTPVLEQPDEFGTGDAVIVDVPKRHLTVVDLKYGMGVKVYAENNEQMMMYAAATLMEYMLASDFDFVTMVIVQPRLDHIDEWTIDTESLLAFVEEARAVIRTGGTTLTPGEKQCRFCRAKATCPALAEFVSKEIFNDFESVDDPALMARRAPSVPADNEKLGQRLANLPIIQNWCTAVRAEGERRVLAGEKIIGSDGLPFKIVEGKSPGRKWLADKLTEIEGKLVATIGTKAYEPQQIISAAAAAKILDKAKTKQTWATFVEFYNKARGKPSIAAGSDPRPPYEGSADASEFESPDELSE